MYNKGNPSDPYFYMMAVSLICAAPIFVGFNSELAGLACPYGTTDPAH